MEASTLYTEAAAALILCVSPKTLSKWRWSGEGPVFIKLGRSVRYQGRDLAEFIARSRTRSTSCTEHLN